MTSYADALNILNKIKYPVFLPLQEKAFQNPALYDSKKNIFVTGDTSSGKTLIPLIHYLLEKEKNLDYKMLFLVPYRALASQKKEEITIILQRVLPNLRVALSTGEYREEDADIFAGDVDVAVIIYEKAYHFACNSEEFLNHYNALVYDEFALSEDDSRGAICDLMLLRGQNASRRLFVLSTPHYSWDQYIHHNHFVPIQLSGQDNGVPREEIPIFLDGASENGKNKEYNNYKGDPIGIDGIRQNGTKDDLIEDLCVRHLQMNHRILVFTNNCDEVRRMARELFKRMRAHHSDLLNPICEDEDACFHRVLDKTGTLEEDLIGLMNPEECLSFVQGICYHNSWLGYDLRSMIEQEILTDEGSLKVVFCTETMAYGINSSVDVVIVADMHKSICGRDYIPEQGENGLIRIRGQSKMCNRFLTVNEYQNYIGRAGRYGRSSKGYAYALMTQTPGKRSIRDQWDCLLKMRSNPIAAESTLLKLDPYCNQKSGCRYRPDGCKHCSLKANEFAMPVMSLITTEGVTYQNIKQQLMCLPGLAENSKWLDRNINTALSRLIWKTRPTKDDYGWVRIKNDNITRKPVYCLTQSGQIMSGFLITMYEANVMMRYLLGKGNHMPEARRYTPEGLKRHLERFPFDLFFQLCYLPELQKIAFEFFEIADVSNEDGKHKRQLYQELCTKQLRLYHKKAISNELYAQLIYSATDSYNYRLRLPTLYRTLLTILIFEWYKNASVSKLNDELNTGYSIVTITPGRISRMSQQLSFYLQMTASLCLTLSDDIYNEIAQLLNRMEICLYFGIREADARRIDVTYLRRLTRQQQLKVAQILDFCANHPLFNTPDELTRRQRNDWKSILRSLHSLPQESDIPQKLREVYPILNTAETLLMKEQAYERSHTI